MSFAQFYPAGIIADADGVIIDQQSLPGEDQMTEAEQLDQALRREMREEFAAIREKLPTVTDKRALAIAKGRVMKVLTEIINDECDDLSEEWKPLPLPGL